MKKITILLLGLMISLIGFTQVTFTNYTVTEGLADDYVCGGVCIDQDNNKWFGTQSGVSFFDGSVWTTFTTTDGLVDNYVTCIAYDSSSDKIWAGTNNGISSYDGSTFENFTTVEGIIDNSIIFITTDNNGITWAATYSGLIKIQDGTVTNYTSEQGLPSTLNTFVKCYGADLYIGTLNIGLIKYDGSTYQTIGTGEGLADNFVSSIELDEAGNVYVGSYAGLTVLNSELSVTYTYTWDLELFNNYVQDIVIDSEGNLIILEYADYLADGGITIFDGEAWNFYSINEGLVDVMVKEADLDSDGNVWITTGSGISKMSLGAGIGGNYINAQASVYPNPAKDYVKIANLEGDFSYQITDITGRIVANGQYVRTNTIDVSTLPNSMYFITYKTDEKVYSAKILVE